MEYSNEIVRDDERLKRYIASVRWTYAKTMPKWPHEYTIRYWKPELNDEFEWAVLYIRKFGIAKPFYKRIHIYYQHTDGNEYWTMGDPLDNTWVINRAKIKKDEHESQRTSPNTDRDSKAQGKLAGQDPR